MSERLHEERELGWPQVTAEMPTSPSQPPQASPGSVTLTQGSGAQQEASSRCSGFPAFSPKQIP